MNETTLNFFGENIKIEEIVGIGAEVEEAKLLWLIPMTRIVPIITMKNATTLKGRGMSPEQVADWVVSSNMLMKLEGKNGEKFISKDGVPGFVYS